MSLVVSTNVKPEIERKVDMMSLCKYTSQQNIGCNISVLCDIIVNNMKGLLPAHWKSCPSSFYNFYIVFNYLLVYV